MKSTKKLTRSALLVGLGVIITYLFHISGINGKVFLPMHFSPLLAGFIVGPMYAALVGAILPGINTLVTGMPQGPVLILMTFELAVFGLVTGFLYKKIGVILSLIAAMLAGRIVYYTLFALFVQFGNPLIMIGGGIATGLPGIIGQLLLIPPIIKILKNKYNLQI
ncbi:MAG: ECF transporter S component [Bacillota bacterium]